MASSIVIPKESFIDIHCHVLPGLDDGAGSMDEALAILEGFAKAGVGCVVATPHYQAYTAWNAAAAQITSGIEELREAAGQADCPVVVLPGMEIHYSSNLFSQWDSKGLLKVGSSAYYLIELPFDFLGKREYDELLRVLREGKKKLIISHPERCRYFQKEPEALLELSKCGALLQMNMDSLSGMFGEREQDLALRLLKDGMVHFLASDAHGPHFNRMPPDQTQLVQLETIIGAGALKAGYRDNPYRLLSGLSVEPILMD